MKGVALLSSAFVVPLALMAEVKVLLGCTEVLYAQFSWLLSWYCSHYNLLVVLSLDLEYLQHFSFGNASMPVLIFRSEIMTLVKSFEQKREIRTHTCY